MRHALLCWILAAAVLGACGPDPTTLASGLSNPSALLVNGSTLYWINDPGAADSSIQSIPITGGKVTTVLSQAGLDGNLATDGTKLYFSSSASNSSVIASCGLDGSGVTTLNSTLQTNALPTNEVSAMFVADGTIYVAAELASGVCVAVCDGPIPVTSPGPFIFSIPAAGGNATVAVPMPETTNPMTATGLSTLYRVDSTGIYYSALTTPADPTGAYTSVYALSFSGGAPATLYTVNYGASQTIPPAGGLTVINGTAYFLSATRSSSNETLLSVSATGGTATTVATYSNQTSTYLVGDANGLYVDNEVQSNSPGIFSATLSGTETSYVGSQHTLSTSVGQERVMVVDSQNVYWFAGGFNSGQGTVHAKAR
jgi:hypothetical protein